MEITKLDINRVTGKNGYSALYICIGVEDGTEGIYGPIDSDSALMADRLLKTANASLAETDSYRKNREVTLSVTHTHHALESSG